MSILNDSKLLSLGDPKADISSGMGGGIAANKILALDAVRGVAALSVFIHHFYQQFFPHSEWGGWGRVLENLGAWGVCIFFVLSGFCIHWSSIKAEVRGNDFSLLIYFKRRILRIYPMFLVAVLLCYLIAFLFESNLIKKSDVGGVIAHLTLTSSFYFDYRVAINSVLWSVVVECHFYILYGFLYERFRGDRVYGMVIASIVFAIITYLVSVIFFKSGEQRNAIQHLFSATWWTWCLGACVAHIHAKSNWNSLGKEKLSVIFVVIVVGSLMTSLMPNTYALQAQRFVLPILCAAGLLVLFDVEYSGRLVNVLGYFGDISYSLYLLHPVAILVLLFLAKDNIALIFLSFPLGFLMAAIGYAAIEKPFQRFAAKTAVN